MSEKLDVFIKCIHLSSCLTKYLKLWIVPPPHQERKAIRGGKMLVCPLTDILGICLNDIFKGKWPLMGLLPPEKNLHMLHLRNIEGRKWPKHWKKEFFQLAPHFLDMCEVRSCLTDCSTQRAAGDLWGKETRTMLWGKAFHTAPCRNGSGHKQYSPKRLHQTQTH